MAFVSSVFAQLKELSQRELYEKVLNNYKHEGYIDYKGYGDDKPCVVLFFNQYCQYCKIMENNIAAVAPKYRKKINFYKVNVFKIDDYTIERLEIQGVPTTLVKFSDGEWEIYPGVVTRQQIAEMLEELIDE